jgi:hypothetical protein
MEFGTSGIGLVATGGPLAIREDVVASRALVPCRGRAAAQLPIYTSKTVPPESREGDSSQHFGRPCYPARSNRQNGKACLLS